MKKAMRPSTFVTIHRSGAIEVDLVGFLKSPRGREQLEDMRRFHDWYLKRCTGFQTKPAMIERTSSAGATAADGGAT